MASFQPFEAANAQGKAYSERAEGTPDVFAAFVNGPVTEDPGVTDVGPFLEMWNIRETHPKGGPVGTRVRCRMRTPDPALPEDAQKINKLAHILRKVLLHRKEIEQEGPAPPTNNERNIQGQLEHRRKRAEGKYT